MSEFEQGRQPEEIVKPEGLPSNVSDEDPAGDLMESVGLPRELKLEFQ